MIWLIGVGYMGLEYAKVLNDLKIDYEVIGRGEDSAVKFENEIGKTVHRGGLTSFLKTNPAVPDAVIVAVSIDHLFPTTKLLLEYGVHKILLEKPGFCNTSELDVLIDIIKEKSASVYLAYNRRFYSSVLAAEKIIEEDKGVTSFNFEFTEWINTISMSKFNRDILRNWVLANSSHVIDTAFYLGGNPIKMDSYVEGAQEIEWHPIASRFAGAGITSKGALFTYMANWNAPGRWVIEILTKKHKLIFKPMETLQIQKLNSVAVEQYQVDDVLDKKFKPGLYLQTKSFLENDYSRFCSVFDQKVHLETFYKKIVECK